MKIPKRLKKRPMFKGMPIPYIALIDDNGKPDFRVTDQAKRFAVMKHALCQLCGEPLGKFCFFVGGPEAAKANQYFEPACHLDCLIYAMQTCPFIAGKMEHADIAKVQKQYDEKIARVAEGITIQADDTYTVVKSPYWVIKKATGWRYIESPGGTILISPFAIAQTPELLAEKMKPDEWDSVYQALMKL